MFQLDEKMSMHVAKFFHKGTLNTCYIHFKLAVDGEGGGVIEIIS